jgi:hypothetical protein
LMNPCASTQASERNDNGGTSSTALAVLSRGSANSWRGKRRGLPGPSLSTAVGVSDSANYMYFFSRWREILWITKRDCTVERHVM